VKKANAEFKRKREAEELAEIKAKQEQMELLMKDIEDQIKQKELRKQQEELRRREENLTIRKEQHDYELKKKAIQQALLQQLKETSEHAESAALLTDNLTETNQFQEELLRKYNEALKAQENQASPDDRPDGDVEMHSEHSEQVESDPELEEQRKETALKESGSAMKKRRKWAEVKVEVVGSPTKVLHGPPRHDSTESLEQQDLEQEKRAPSDPNPESLIQLQPADDEES
jgi:hypothetical protein